MGRIRIGLVGVGNCASSLLQGIEYYRSSEPATRADHVGLMHYDLGGYTPADIEVVCAFDIDERKVGQPLEVAVFSPPNNTAVIAPVLGPYGVTVQMGPILDGVSDHMLEEPAERSFRPARREPVDVVQTLRESGAEILLNYLPVGSEEAATFYARACLETGVSLINCMPVFIVSDPEWGAEFARRRIPVVGDDVKSQLGATIVHRMLGKLFTDRGVRLVRTYQLNTGGNTDFLNMLNRSRLASKKRSKTDAVQSVLPAPLPEQNIHIGPSDYVPWQQDNKICFLRMEGRAFGNMPVELDLRLSVEDSANSAGVAIDAIRSCRLARDRGIGGPLISVSACSMKHPPVQMSEEEARAQVERFIRSEIHQ